MGVSFLSSNKSHRMLNHREGLNRHGEVPTLTSDPAFGVFFVYCQSHHPLRKANTKTVVINGSFMSK